MSSPEISEDDSNLINLEEPEVTNPQDVIQLSSDNETDNYYTSDEDLPAVDLGAKKSAVIKNLFPTSKAPNKSGKSVPSTSMSNSASTFPVAPVQIIKDPGFVRMIGGVKVNLPCDPYGCQVALMSKVITAIQKSQNCLLESPTGSGKTLALLCAALAWQQQERDRIAVTQAQSYFSNYPELSEVEGSAEYIASPPKSKHNPQEILFGKSVFGAKSIYDKPGHDVGDDASFSCKRQEPLCDAFEEFPTKGQVTIHKKRRLNDAEVGECSKTSPPLPTTPEKGIPQKDQKETPESVNLPTIYYGARTHKQLQQVIKEFGRTHYSGSARMTVLSSREYSCIREFDRQTWGTKNDMCRGCVKKTLPAGTPKKDKNETNCKFYDNRQALNHESLPAYFDLEDLVAAGHELTACPYYAARGMAQKSQIVFCPYNYLIEPGIRSSMSIDLRGNIVIIDEAHNIEDICRDAATFTITRDNLQAALKELEVVASYRYSNQDVMSYIDRLIKILNNWNDWFTNQMPWLNNQPVNNNEAVYIWQIENFVQTLNDHNIGQQQYSDFRECAELFCRKLREDPRPLMGVTQATGTLIESMDTVLGYLFREDGRYKDDFKPALIRTVFGGTDGPSESAGWRKSQFNQWVEKESVSLRLMCMNPAVIFEGLKVARCIVLASGTLTPLVSLHSELATEFPLQISPNHVIPSDRVWIGTLTTCPNGQPLECNSRGTEKPDVQDALGQAVLWVCQVTPHGVLCFLPSYMLMNKLAKRWRDTGLWQKLNAQKHVLMESRNVKDHNEIMEDYYNYVSTDKGALLFAVYRGKVSEGMDFKDHQARAVITIGVPYPNTFDMAVKEKMNYNNKYSNERKLLSSAEWLRVQAYRALNQAVGRCVRHRGDWGAVLLVDARFTKPYYTEHLSKWVRNFLGNNHHTFESLVNSPNSLESFMQNMRIRESEDLN